MNRSRSNRAGLLRLLPALAALLAIGALPGASLAAAREGGPGGGASWFRKGAVRAVEAALVDARTLDEAMPLRPGGLEVGAIARVHDINPEALDGKSKELLVAREEWVAPLYSEGELVGSVAVWRDPAQKGALTLAYFDTDAATGSAIEALSVDARLVVDPPIGARFAFDGESLTSLVEVPGVLKSDQRFGIEEYGDYLRERNAATAHLSPEEAWSGGYEAPGESAGTLGQIVQLLGALAFVVGLGLFVAQRKRTA